MTPKQHKALQALLTCPTKRAAAAEAGIDEKTLRRYLADPAFQKEYKRAFQSLVTDATREAQKTLSPAIIALKSIMEDEGESAGSRISAARSLLDFGMRLTEISDILDRLTELEEVLKGDNGR